jgi:hypothetical protein
MQDCHGRRGNDPESDDQRGSRCDVVFPLRKGESGLLTRWSCHAGLLHVFNTRRAEASLGCAKGSGRKRLKVD